MLCLVGEGLMMVTVEVGAMVTVVVTGGGGGAGGETEPVGGAGGLLWSRGSEFL